MQNTMASLGFEKNFSHITLLSVFRQSHLKESVDHLPMRAMVGFQAQTQMVFLLKSSLRKGEAASRSSNVFSKELEAVAVEGARKLRIIEDRISELKVELKKLEGESKSLREELEREKKATARLQGELESSHLSLSEALGNFQEWRSLQVFSL